MRTKARPVASAIRFAEAQQAADGERSKEEKSRFDRHVGVIGRAHDYAPQAGVGPSVTMGCDIL
jgi:hypothetical protein